MPPAAALSSGRGASLPSVGSGQLEQVMKHALRSAVAVVVGGLTLLFAGPVAGDWPQWRGANRDGRAGDFAPPGAWPKELKPAWTVPVGDGVATPALVGDKLYVFSRQEGNEITRCLQAADGQEVWADMYAAMGAQGAAASFSWPRSSPAGANGKVVT